MEETKEKKQEVRNQVAKALASLSEKEIAQKLKNIESRLFDFANFLEAKIALLYMNTANEVPTKEIIQRCYEYSKIVVLPVFASEKFKMSVLKVDNAGTDLKTGPRGVLEPDPNLCKKVPIECIDIAIIPGVAMDEKGGRLGSGKGYYDRFIPKLPITTRKVGLAFECQIVQQIPMESHDKHVDIIITEDRIIYKI